MVSMMALEDLRISNISARPVEYISGIDPAQLPPRDGLLRPLGAVDENRFLYVTWLDRYGDCCEAVVRVEATR